MPRSSLKDEALNSRETYSDLLELDEAAGWWNTQRPLTHSSDSSREGLGMNPTHIPRAARPSAHAIPPQVMHRALTKSEYDPETGCHISTYSTASHGYAQIGWSMRGATGGKTNNAGTTAHRAAWTAVHGPIPEGMTIDHTCKNRKCVNPSHMRMLSNYENARRTAGRDWPEGECVNGHSNDHLRMVDGGTRLHCGICHSEWHGRYRAKARQRKAG